MDAIDAIVRAAAARGIDLNYVAGVASNVDGVAKRRKLSPEAIKFRNEAKLSLDVSDTAKGRETRSSRPPAWTVAELGQAAGGLGAIPWAAAFYSIAGSRDGYWLLHHALVSEAQRFSRRDGWVPRVVGEDGQWHFYREELAQLVLVEDANKQLFMAAPPLYAIAMKVTIEVWEKHLDQPFRTMKISYDRWLNVARAVISRRIRGDHDDV